eukprot:s2448_g1.t1
MTRVQFLTNLRLHRYCLAERSRCLVKHNGEFWNLHDLRARVVSHGDYLEVTVPPPQRLQEPTVLAIWYREKEMTNNAIRQFRKRFQTAAVESDEKRPRTHHSSEDRQVDGPTFERPIETIPEVPVRHLEVVRHDGIMQDLQTAWHAGAAIEMEEEGPVLYIQTWFSDQIFRPRSRQSRPVRLLNDPTQWPQDIENAWNDLLDISVAVHLYLIRPAPETSITNRQLVCHVLLVQHPIPGCSSIMITSLDSAHPEQGVVPQIAVTRQDVTKDSLILTAELERACLPAVSDLQCMVWFGDVEIQPQEELLARHGFNFFIVINSIFGPPSDGPSPWDDIDDLQLLQHSRKVVRPTAGSVAQDQRPTLSLEQCLSPPAQIHVDFSPVIWLQQQIDSISIGPLQHWPTECEIPDVTHQAFSQLTGTPDELPIAFHFYVDGSHVKHGCVGSGIVALVQTEKGLYLGGCVSKKLTVAACSYLGEHGAMTWALIWAIQISQWHVMHHPTNPIDFVFHFDALATGYQAAGWWNAWKHEQWRTLLRSLAQVLQTRHGFDHLHWQHVKAHTGNPWNELADSLAKFASVHSCFVDDSLEWTHWLDDPITMNAMQWLWFLHRPAHSAPQTPVLQGSILQHSLIPPVSLDLPVPHRCIRRFNQT